MAEAGVSPVLPSAGAGGGRAPCPPPILHVHLKEICELFWKNRLNKNADISNKLVSTLNIEKYHLNTLIAANWCRLLEVPHEREPAARGPEARDAGRHDRAAEAGQYAARQAGGAARDSFSEDQRINARRRRGTAFRVLRHPPARGRANSTPSPFSFSGRDDGDAVIHPIPVTTRTAATTVTFKRPFILPGVDGVHPAGCYAIETVSELLQGLSFVAYHRTYVAIRLPASAEARGRTELVILRPEDLNVILEQDAAGP
jgi:hypothetical protein